jgi:hypothetical protein
MGTDVYASYENGLCVLLQRLGKDHLEYQEVLVYQQRLIENISQARRYRDTSSLQYERIQVIDQLNNLSISSLGVSFNELCNTSSIPVSSPKSAANSYTNDATSGEVTQNFINIAPNEGGQGVFYEQVTFNR